MKQAECIARIKRNGHIESEHFGQVVLCHADGRIEHAFGDPDIATFMRSSAKPFQAITVLQTGAADKFGWTEEEIALVCASHHAEPDHLAGVRSILAKAGLTEDDLQCGPHPPIHVPSRDALIKAGQSPTRIHNNCSGKHAGMLSACVAAGWDTKTYLQTDHPLQQMNAKNVARFAGVEGEKIPTGTDGCGVPTFYLPIREMAVMYAQLASEAKNLEDLHQSSARVSHALRAYPRMVSGTDQFTAVFGKHVGFRAFSKGGAEGVIGVGIPELSMGLAIKSSDGSSRALAIVVCRVLAELLPDLNWDAIRAAVNPPIKNTLGESVGTIEAAI